MASSRMIALLGLLAVAGYQNRDRIGQFLGGILGQNRNPANPLVEDRSNAADGDGGLMGMLGNLFGGGSRSSGLQGGLSDLIDHFTGRGHGDTAGSWVSTGANQQMDRGQLESALGEDTIAELTRHTGMSRDELLSRLRTVLPTAVDTLTPEGRLPTERELAALPRPPAV